MFHAFVPIYIFPANTLQWTHLSLPNDCIEVCVPCPQIKGQRLLMLTDSELPLSYYLYYPGDCCVRKVGYSKLDML
jgi:hypothetical protein